MISISIASISKVREMADYDLNTVVVGDESMLSELRCRLRFVDDLNQKFEELKLIAAGTQLRGVDYSISNPPVYRVGSRINTCINIEMVNENLVARGGVQLIVDAIEGISGAIVYLTMDKYYVEGGIECVIDKSSITVASFSAETAEHFKGVLEQILI